MRHRPSSQVVEYRGRLFMIDCGEGAQVGMRQCGLKFSRLTDIFISHLHGDHILGLPGLLSTMGLHENRGSVTIHMFEEGIKVMRPFIDFFCKDSPFEIIYDPISPRNQTVWDNGSLSVTTFPLYHRVPATGFLFREAPKRPHLRGDMADFFGIPLARRAEICAGADFVTEEGTVIENSRLTFPAEPPSSYAYCSDTMYDPRVTESVKGVGTLYHEATYDNTLERQARARGHSTAREAALTALEAGAGKLIIGHYSQRYKTVDRLLEEAREIFPNTVAAYEGMKADLRDTSNNNSDEQQ